MDTTRVNRRAWPAIGLVAAAAFIVSSILLMKSVIELRDDLEARVTAVSLITRIEDNLRDGAIDAVAPDVEQLAETGVADDLELDVESCVLTVVRLRAELHDISLTLARRWEQLFAMLGVAGLVALMAAALLSRNAAHMRALEKSRAALQAARAEAEEASRAKSELLARVSHDLRTPLNAIIGFSNLLLDNEHGRLSEKELDYLRRVRRGGFQLLELVNSMLDLSAIESGRLEVENHATDVAALVADCVAPFELAAEKKNLKLVIDVPMGLAPIETDGLKLGQMLLNLIGNAVKFTAQGSVTVRVVADADRPRRIDVIDSGIGIPADQLEVVFESFRQLDRGRDEGSGLGLSITRSLAELLGFTIEASSEPGRGSTFSILLQEPAARPRESVSPPLDA